jgi:hypothetical protein
MPRTETAALLVVSLLTACASRELPPPHPTAVVPAHGFATIDTSIEIAGEDFHVRAVQRADGGGSTVDAGFRAWLGPAELLDVAWSTPRRLVARVPPGLAAGWYDLAVEGPSGTGILPHAYLAVDGAPPSLAVSLVAPPEVTIG